MKSLSKTKKNKPKSHPLILFIKRFLLLSILLGAIYFKQYIFIILIMAGALLVYLIAKKPFFIDRYNLYTNELVDELFELKINENSITFKNKNNIFKLSNENINSIQDFDDFYFFNHKSTFTIIIPKMSLSEKEIDYFKSHPQLWKNNGKNKIN